MHADELPGLLVAQHLVKILDKAIAANAITGEIVIVPFANPIGLSQSMMDVHLGRFSFETVTNFNRSWPDLGRQVAKKVASRLSASDSEANVAIIRSAIVESVASWEAVREEEALKKELFALSAVSDIVLDLHCDDNALLHMYTHTRLWPQLESLSAAIQSHCQLLAPCSGGHPFDEACSGIWSYLQDQFPQAAIPMACESATIELRGLYDVCDTLSLLFSVILRLMHRWILQLLRKMLAIFSSFYSSEVTSKQTFHCKSMAIQRCCVQPVLSQVWT